jgi:hypothetical protein
MGGGLDMWNFLGESVIGKSHIRLGVPCQDAYAVSPLRTANDEDVMVLVCADGAGSASLSQIGSRAACDLVIKKVDQYFQSGGDVNLIQIELVKEWVEQIRGDIAQLSLENGVDCRQMACTLLVAIVGESASVFFQLGDGVIVVREGEQYVPVFWPQNGEFANSTYFITDDTALENLVFRKNIRIDELAVLTDGLQMLALDYAGKQAYSPFFIPLFRALQNTESVDNLQVPFRQHLSSDRINEKTDDDKTLVIASRINSKTSLPGPLI